MADIDMNDIRRVDGGLLLVFRELLRQRQTTVTAKRLGLSQSAISHALTRLRDIFGDPLFTRLPHGLEPTRRALELGPRIEALIDMTAAALSGEAAFDPARSQRRFRIAAPEFVTATVGPPLLEQFAREAPGVSVALEFMPRDSALKALHSREIDLMLSRAGRAPAGIAAEVLYEDAHCVVARRGHPRLKGRRISLKAYCEIGLVFAGSPVEVADDEIRPHPRQVKTLAIVPQWLTALAMVAASDALASCPRRLAERQAKVMGLQLFPLPFAAGPWPIFVTRRERETDDGIVWLLDQLRQAAAAR